MDDRINRIKPDKEVDREQKKSAKALMITMRVHKENIIRLNISASSL